MLRKDGSLKLIRVSGFWEEGGEKNQRKGMRFSGGCSGRWRGGTLKEFKSFDAEPGNEVLSFGSCLRAFTGNRDGLSSFGHCLVFIAFFTGVTGRDFTASQRERERLSNPAVDGGWMSVS